MGPSKPQTKAEKQRNDRLADMHCPCCRSVEFMGKLPVEIHHIIVGNKRLGHWYTLPLCKGHHKGEWHPAQLHWFHESELVSIASGRRAFEGVYGKESAIWRKIQVDNGWDHEWPSSKIVRRKAA